VLRGAKSNKSLSDKAFGLAKMASIGGSMDNISAYVLSLNTQARQTHDPSQQDMMPRQ
jgi:hypothetical protein